MLHDTASRSQRKQSGTFVSRIFADLSVGKLANAKNRISGLVKLAKVYNWRISLV